MRSTTASRSLGSAVRNVTLMREGATWRSVEVLQDRVDDLLAVAEQHHGVVREVALVLDTGLAGAHAAFDEEDRLRLLDVEDRHAEDRRGRIRLGGRVRDVVRADDEGDVRLRELAVDVLELEDLVVGNVRLG